MTKAVDKALGIGTTRDQNVANRLEPATRQVLAELTAGAGLGADWARVLLIERMRWHINRGPKPIAITPHRPADIHAQGHVIRRAWELVDANRHRLPPVNENTSPTAEWKAS